MEIKKRIVAVLSLDRKTIKLQELEVIVFDYNGESFYLLNKTAFSNEEMQKYNYKWLLHESKDHKLWNFEMYLIDIKKFGIINAVQYTQDEINEYREIQIEYIKKFNYEIGNVFKEKINSSETINVLELEYIKKYFPEIYQEAKVKYDINKKAMKLMEQFKAHQLDRIKKNREKEIER